MDWETSFEYHGKRLQYNRIPYNNIAERAIEVPIAFEFLSRYGNIEKVVEIGNVLSNYETESHKFPRQIVDKYEVFPNVINVDLMEMPEDEKYDCIVCVSTVEHVGQSWANFVRQGYKFIEPDTAERDLEAPLQAIVKVYNLISKTGRALITVPYGKFMDGVCSIQFGEEYLSLLTTKYGIPAAEMQTIFYKRIASEGDPENPRQVWIKVEPAELRDTCYDSPFPCGNGIAVIELTHTL